MTQTNSQFAPQVYFTPPGSTLPVPGPKFALSADSLATSVNEMFMTVPSTNVSIHLPVPSQWTVVTSIGIVNIDPTTVVSIKMNDGTNNQYMNLGPDPLGIGGVASPGGALWLTNLKATYSGGPALTVPADWLLQTVIPGGSASTLAANIYVYMAGY